MGCVNYPPPFDGRRLPSLVRNQTHFQSRHHLYIVATAYTLTYRGINPLTQAPLTQTAA